MHLDFSSQEFRNEVMTKQSVNYDNGFSAAAAFLLVLTL